MHDPQSVADAGSAGTANGAAAAPRFMTQAAYARHRGISKQSVNAAVKAGRLKLTRSGLVNVAIADATWEENSDPVRGGDRRPGRNGARGHARAPLSVSPLAASGRSNGATPSHSQPSAEIDPARNGEAEPSRTRLNAQVTKIEWQAK